MTASLYRGEIRDLPVGADLLPYLILEAPYEECVAYLHNIPHRHDVVLYWAMPQFDIPQPIPVSGWIVEREHWITRTLALPALD